MSDRAESVPGRPARRRPVWWVGLALLAGCTNPAPGPDPLVTSRPSPKAAAGAVAAAPADPIPITGVASGAGAAGGVPPLTDSHAVVSPAALASNAVPTTDKRDLRIDGGAPAGSPPTSGWGPPTTGGSSGWPAPGAGGTPLSQTSDGRLAPFSMTSAGGGQPLASSPSGDAYQQYQTQLRDRGVTYQRLETWGDSGEWRFFCSIPSRENRFILRNYEAKAAGEYGLNAIRLVLEKIDAGPRP